MDLTEIIVSVVGGLALVSAASVPAYFTYRTHKSLSSVSESVGKKNGHGSIQDQLDVMWQMEELDKQARELGQERQSRIEEYQDKLAKDIKALYDCMRKQEGLLQESVEQFKAHAKEDKAFFDELNAKGDSLQWTLTKLIATLGEAEDWAVDGTTLIKYLRDWHHDDLSRVAKSNMLSDTQKHLLEKAIHIIEEYESREPAPQGEAIDDDYEDGVQP